MARIMRVSSNTNIPSIAIGETALADLHPGAVATRFGDSSGGFEPTGWGTDPPYGEGSHAPLDDPAEAPDGYSVKGNADCGRSRAMAHAAVASSQSW